MSAKPFLGDVLRIVYSEIAYYRYLFPESCFEKISLVDTVSHRLVKGKSVESDQILENIDGICDALDRDAIKTLVIGISISPVKPTFVRELYAFQFSHKSKEAASKNSAKRRLQMENATTTLFLNRLVAFLEQMERALAPCTLTLLTWPVAPIALSSRMTLTDSTAPNYLPPSFLPFPTKGIEGYTILPHCGSARVGKAERDGSAMFMCALCVEGAVQIPTLGSVPCAMPMSLDVDDNSQETVFVASPGWALNTSHGSTATGQNESSSAATTIKRTRVDSSDSKLEEKPTELKCECAVLDENDEMWTCSGCTRRCHMLCYGQQGGINRGSERPACLTCVLCDKEGSAEPNYPIRYLTMARRIGRIMQKQPSGRLASLIRKVGGSDKRSREVVDLIENLGLIVVLRNERPYEYKSKLEARPELAESLFSSDIGVLRKLIGGPFSTRISKKRQQQALG